MQSPHFFNLLSIIEYIHLFSAKYFAAEWIFCTSVSELEEAALD